LFEGKNLFLDVFNNDLNGKMTIDDVDADNVIDTALVSTDDNNGNFTLVYTLSAHF
jgi:hypothetical protein